MRSKLANGLLCMTLSALLLLVGCGPGPTTLANTSAGNLDVSITIYDDLANASQQAAVVVAFRKNGALVQFTNGETISCDGVVLSMFSALLGYMGGVPYHVPAGGSFTFVYTSQTVATMFVWTVPATFLPVITTPQAGKTITRSESNTLTYTAVLGPPNTMRVQITSGSTANNFSSLADIGMISFRGASIPAGSGTVQLFREISAPQTATGFHSLTVDDEAGTAPINVTWA